MVRDTMQRLDRAIRARRVREGYRWAAASILKTGGTKYIKDTARNESPDYDIAFDEGVRSAIKDFEKLKEGLLAKIFQ